MRSDHLLHWVPDLDAAVRDYQALGFTVQPGGQHPQFGTHNAAWRLDTSYIELIAVRDEAAARKRLGPEWPELAATLRSGGGAGAFGVLVADVAATEVPDPPASASWLADIFELDVVRIAQDVAEVRLPGCAIAFVCGSADRITAVVLTGRGAPEGPVAGLHYLAP